MSIIIPVYNGADFLSHSIDSALAQTYSPVEIIVVNDGSCDGGATERVASSYGNRIRYLAKMNGGVSSALNCGIDAMRGEYFSWLSHDDLYHPDKIRLQMEAVENSEAVKIIYSDYAIFNGDPVSARPIHLPAIAPGKFRFFLTTESLLHGCALLIPREAFRKYGVFNERLRTTQDYEMWFRLAAHYQFHHVPEVLVMGRQHPKQGSITMREQALVEVNALLSGFLSELSVDELAFDSNQNPARAYATIARHLYKRGLSGPARRAVIFSFQAWGGVGFLSAVRSAASIVWTATVGELITGIRSVRNRLRRVVRPKG